MTAFVSPVTQRIAVRHNVEMAHRLFLTPGKCQRIHGHSYLITLTITGLVDDNGLLSGIDYGTLKQLFRGHLDNTYDHRILLNREDPWAGKLHWRDDAEHGWMELPGLRTFNGDPTTENLSKAVGEWALGQVLIGDEYEIEVGVWETAVNQASWTWRRPQ